MARLEHDSANDNGPDLSIIIPAYNEAGAIGATIARIFELQLPSYEILVIDDGSRDDTAKEAAEAGATVISHPYNIGNGAAVKTGIRAAKGKVLCFMDGDGQHDPKDILKLLPFIAMYHMVVGARQRRSHAGFHRMCANTLYNSFASFIAQFKIEDLTSGMRMMRQEDALRFCDMFPNGFSYPTTSTLAFLRSGRSIKYVSIQTKHRVGKSKIKLAHDGFEFLIIIMKIAMAFSPLRVFLPVSAFMFFCGIFRYAYTYSLYGKFTNMSHFLISSSVMIFMLGLIAEQIAALRMERGDKLFLVEDPERYQSFSQYGDEPKSGTPIN